MLWKNFVFVACVASLALVACGKKESDQEMRERIQKEERIKAELKARAAVDALKTSSEGHRVVYGAKHKITADHPLGKFEQRLTKCRVAVFTHADLPYKPKKGGVTDDYKKAVEAVVKGVKTCLAGEVAADGMGYSGRMAQSHLVDLLKHEDCRVFAEQIVKFRHCQYLFEDLPGHADFDDGL